MNHKAVHRKCDRASVQRFTDNTDIVKEANIYSKNLHQVKSNVRTVMKLIKRQIFLFQHPTCYRCVFYHI